MKKFEIEDKEKLRSRIKELQQGSYEFLKNALNKK